MSLKDDFEESVRLHWEYVKEVVRDGRDDAEGITLSIQDYLTIIGFHYKTAMLHGYKHGREDYEGKS